MNILLLRDINNDHDELIKTLKTFEKPVVILNDMQLCISFLSNSSHQINNRQSILIVLNRVGRQIVPEIHSLVNLSFIVIFCTKKDNKIKWTGKYNKIKGIYINSEELVKCVRHLMKKSNLLRSYPCQLVFLDEHLNEMMRQQLYRLDSSLIVFKRIHLCLDYILSAAQERFLILITVNALGRQIVPEIHDNNQLKAVFIFCNMNSEKIKWTTKYNKIKVVTNDIAELIQCVRNEGFYHSTLPWHLVCLDDRCDELLRDRMHELDPCVQTFNQFSICERYLTSFHKDTNAKKSILFITTNRIGRQFIPEIHTNNKIQAFYIFIPSDSAHDRRTRWTKKYNKIKCVCTDLDQLVTYIKQDTNEYLVNNIDVHQSVSHVPTTTSEIGAIHSNEWTNNDCIQFYHPVNIDVLENADYDKSTIILCKTSSAFLKFSDIPDCMNYLDVIHDQKFTLVASEAIVEKIIPSVHERQELDSIYVFPGTEKTARSERIKGYRKIRREFDDIESIFTDMKQSFYQSNEDLVPISFVSTSDNSLLEVDLHRLDPSFMYTQLLKEILLNMDYDETAIGDFSRYCRERFPDDSTHLRRIEKFEREYYTQSPIYWYTGDVGIYSILNRALRTLDVEASIKMGFFIRDLHRQIEQLYNEQRNGYGIQPFTVYRGQGLSITDFNQLCKTRGGLISFNNFLSTSKNREISLFFAESNQFNPDLVGVNFVLQINPTISSTPFASIEETSYFEVESEVLFAMHSVFRIVHIQSMGERDKLYSVELTLTSENDPQLQELTERISDSIQGGTGLQRLGALMIEMGQYNKAIEIYQNLLNATQSYEDEAGVSSVYNQLGAVYNRIGDFDQALNYYKKSLTMKNKFLFSNDPSLSPIYSNIGSVLRNQNQLDEALKYMTRALNIEREASPPNELRLASYHNNIGLVFMDKGRYSEALSNYEQALEIQQRCLPSNHPELATLYNNIGTIYNEWKEYSKALSYYERSLEIMQKSLPSGHPDLATAYNNIGSLYNELYDYEKALLFYERALNIMQRSLPANHPSLLDVYRNLVLTHSFLSSS